MKNLFILVLTLIVLNNLTFAQPYLMKNADASKDNIVFNFENDLWLVPITGGTAKRITNGLGNENFPKFSPDGKKIAFTANYDGGTDVYVMNTEGGTPIRLTYHPSASLVLDWYPDGKYILFRSTREYPFRVQKLYKISIEGGMPEKLPVDRGGLASLSPDGKSIAYNNISRETATWKRHIGGDAQDIWLGNLEKLDYKPITDFIGTDNYPMWYNNYIYFTSDRKDGTLNIFKYDINSKETKQVTFYKDYDVKTPSLGSDQIIYSYGEELYLLDLATEKSTKVNITINSDKIFTSATIIRPENFTGNFTPSVDGSRLIMDVRGEIINFAKEDEAGYNLTNSSSTREKNPAVSPDGKSVAFLSDKTGEEEVYITDINGKSEWKQITKGGKGYREQLVFSPDGKYLLFNDKFMKLNLVDVASGKITIITQSDYDDSWYNWGIRDYSFSPDSKWICYAKLDHSMYQSIFIYSLDKQKEYRVTSSLTQDWSPSFSKDGKYLYFLSNRTFNPIMDFVDQNHIFMNMGKPYLVILKEGDLSPFSLNYKDTKENRKDNLTITTEDFESRTVPVDIESGNLFRLEAVNDGFLYLKKNDPEFLKYQFVDDKNSETNLDLYKYSLSKQNSNQVVSGISQYHVSADGTTLAYKAGTIFGLTGVDKAKVGEGKINVSSVTIQINRIEEFMQIFNEAWRIERDWFYDAGMHGLNWTKAGEKYRKFVPYCGTREDLNYLIGEMISELNAGHTYIYGGDLSTSTRVSCGLLGADIVLENGYPKVKHIIKTDINDETAYSPLSEPGLGIKEGDFILAVDGVEIAKNDNFYKYFVNKANKIVELTYNSKTSLEGAKTCLVKPVSNEVNLRYKEWIRDNSEYVTEKTDGKVGYVHIPGMMENGLIEFARLYYPQYYKDGFIIDARYNTGGFTSKQIIDRLERKPYGFVKPREGGVLNAMERAFNGKLILLINMDTGSDGELFSEAWKHHKLGTVIGMRTWGGAVGIEPHQTLIDGATCTPPQFGEFTSEGKWIIEGHGVDPDIVIMNMPGNVVKGIDEQLDKAIEVILQQIKESGNKTPEVPNYPDKSKETLK